MSNIRKKLIATLTVFALLFTSLSAVMFAGSNIAKAEGEETTPEVEIVFQLIDGAASGYLGVAADGKNYAGLKWETQINKAYYDSLLAKYPNASFEFGTFIAPKQYAAYMTLEKYNSDEEIYISNIVSRKANGMLEDMADDASGKYIMYSAIRYEELVEGLTEEQIADLRTSYATELMAKSYIRVVGENGENLNVIYSEADTLRSLRNSVAYNILAGNFSEEVADLLRGIAVEKEIISLGEAQATCNRDNNVVNFAELKDKENVEFAINSQAINATMDVNGNISFGSFNADGKYAYLSAFVDGNLYYKKISVIKAIATAKEFVETFSLAEGDLTTASTVDELALFDQYYVLEDNIDFAGQEIPTETFTAIGLDSADINAYYATGVEGNYGLTGTFDGQGYALYNLVVPRGGIFGVVKGTIKNVAFMDISTSTDELSGLIAAHLYSGTQLSNIYLSYKGDSLSKVALLSASVNYDVKVNSCYFIGDLNFIKSTTNGTAETGKYRYAGALQDEANTAIIISRYLLGARGGWFSEGNEAWMDGTSAGTTSEMGESFVALNEGKTEGVAYRFKGAVYRYVSVDEMLSIYNDLEGAYPQTTSLNNLINKWDKTYFDVVRGLLVWNSDYTSYKLYSDEKIVEDNKIQLALAFRNQTGLSIRNGAGSVVNDFIDITYSLPENDVVSLEGNTLTAISEGQTILTVSYGETTLNITIEVVIKPGEDFSDKTIILDAFGEEIDGLDTVVSAKVQGVDATAIVKDNKVAVKFASEPSTEQATTFTIQIETEDKILTYTAKYYTSYIKTPAELVETFSFGSNTFRKEAIATAANLAVFDGYYVLANNIDFADDETAKFIDTFTLNIGYTQTESGKTSNGLTGTFDGQGYTIYNLETPNGGLFGLVSGTIKNVGFVQLSSTTPKKGVLARYMSKDAILQNVYIKSDKYDTEAVSRGALLAETADTHVLLDDCYFEINLHLYNYTTVNGAAGGAAHGDGNGTAIIISKQILSSRYGFHSDYDYDANNNYSNTIHLLDGLNIETVERRPTAKLARYDSVEALLATYNKVPIDGYTMSTTKQANVWNLIADFDSAYFTFDAVNGMTWNRNANISDSTLYADNVLVDDVISLNFTSENEVGLSVRNNNGFVLNNNDIIYSIPEDNGVISLEGATLRVIDLGETTLTVKYDDVTLFVVTVRVTSKPIEDRTDTTVILDSFGEEIDGLDAIYSASVEGIEGATASVVGNKVAVKFASEPSKEKATTFIIQIETEDKIISYTAEYYTSYIKTPAELVETFSFGSNPIRSEIITTAANLPVFGGYYVLANNIDFADDKTAVFSDTYTDANIKYKLTETGFTSNGLTGTFDGQGYTIYNLETPYGGLFGLVSGTIKNVGFVQLSSTTPAKGVLSGYMTKTAQLYNVYIKSDKYDGENAVASGALLGLAADRCALLEYCYFEINLHLYNFTSNNGAAHVGIAHGANKGHGIVVSEQAPTSGDNWDKKYFELNSSLSNYNGVVKDGTADLTITRNNWASSSIGRYDCVKSLMDAYTSITDVQTLVSGFKTTYFTFDETKGMLWNTDTAN